MSDIPRLPSVPPRRKRHRDVNDFLPTDDQDKVAAADDDWHERQAIQHHIIGEDGTAWDPDPGATYWSERYDCMEYE